MLDTFAFAAMIGLRLNMAADTSSASFSLGVGLGIDRKPESLGNGIEINQPLPSGGTEILFNRVGCLGAKVPLPSRSDQRRSRPAACPIHLSASGARVERFQFSLGLPHSLVSQAMEAR